MISTNPFSVFRGECENALEKSLEKTYSDILVRSITFEHPPSPKFGDLASSICFELSKQVKEKPREMAECIAKNVEVSQYPLIESVKAEGKGYINFFADFTKLSALTIESIRKLDKEYGKVKTEDPKRIIVEHTSVNPVHPIHVGQARNSILGEALACFLSARGHTVRRHFYIDDVGRQTAVTAYGYEKMGMPDPKGKPDHFLGDIYTVTNCITEIFRLNKDIERAKRSSRTKEIVELRCDLKGWLAIEEDLKERIPDLFNELLEKITEDLDAEISIRRIIRGYESGEKRAKNLLRRVCNICIEGFKGSLEKIGIFFDSWDWESSYIWNGDVEHVINRLKDTPYVFQVDDALEFDAEKTAQCFKLKRKLGLKEGYSIPSLTMVRGDGTTLYTTRDIAYTIWKFQMVDKVINVIGADQILSQLQLKLALYALGYDRLAENLIHFAFNLVRFPSHRMSSRRGHYIALDEVIDEAVKRALKEVSMRSPHLSEKERQVISKAVGIGALKYALLEVDPTKQVVFTWDRVLNFEKNSAPYIQYSHARACSILRKADSDVLNPDYSLLKAPQERMIILMLARFSEVFIDTTDSIKPNVLVDFVTSLADKFNTFYALIPVLKAEPLELSHARLVLVDAVSIVLRNVLNLLGIEALEKM